jgi:hypothetical protein
MENTFLPIIKYCGEFNLDLRVIPDLNPGSYLLIEQQGAEIDKEKIILIEIEENMIYRISFTKSKIDVLCKTEKPTLTEEALNELEERITTFYKKEQLKIIFN